MTFATKAVSSSRARLFAAFFALVLAFGACAKDAGLNYLPNQQPDAIELLAPPPLPGSPEQAADLAEVRAWTLVTAAVLICGVLGLMLHSLGVL